VPVVRCPAAHMRWGELAALRRSDLDLTAATVRVERTQVEVGGRVTEGPPKSRAGRRVVAFPSPLVPAAVSVDCEGIRCRPAHPSSLYVACCRLAIC